jgi:hypothetical protein
MEVLEGQGISGIGALLLGLGLVLLLSGIGLAKFEKIEAKPARRTWVAGLVLLACGGAILVSGGLSKSSSRNSPAAKQEVAWAPDGGGPPGIEIRSPATAFISFDTLKEEIPRRLFNQVDQVPDKSTIRVADLLGKPNMIVQVVKPGGEVIGNMWFGKDPRENGFNWDGLIRVGVPKEMRDDRVALVWETFQRHSDGSYFKLME